MKLRSKVSLKLVSNQQKWQFSEKSDYESSPEWIKKNNCSIDSTPGFFPTEGH